MLDPGCGTSTAALNNTEDGLPGTRPRGLAIHTREQAVPIAQSRRLQEANEEPNGSEYDEGQAVRDEQAAPDHLGPLKRNAESPRVSHGW